MYSKLAYRRALLSAVHSTAVERNGATLRTCVH